MLTKTPNGRTTTGSAPFAPPKKHRRRLGPWIAVLILVILASAAAAVFLLRPSAKETYVTNPVTVQDLTQTVTASGTVNAQNTILVGTQVSGTIQSIYVDYNSRVREGQVLARLDPSQFQAQLAQNQSALLQTRAQAGAASQNAVAARFSTNASSAAVVSAGANLAKARSTLVLAQQTLARDKTLLAQGFIPQSQYDADYANFVAAQTGLRAAAAAVTQSTAQTLQSGSSALGSASSADAAAAAVEASKAAVEQAQLNLSRTVITSPVDGTVWRATFRSVKPSLRAFKPPRCSPSRKISRRWRSTSPSVKAISETSAAATASHSPFLPIRRKYSTESSRKCA